MTVECYLLDVRRLTLAHGQTALHHIAGQTALHGGGTVLHVYHCHVRVGALAEEHADAGATRIRGRRRHVHHALHAVDGLLERHHHALLYRLSIGSRIAGHQSDGGRRNLRKLLKGKARKADESQQHHQHADDASQYRAVYEEAHPHPLSTGGAFCYSGGCVFIFHFLFPFIYPLPLGGFGWALLPSRLSSARLPRSL